MERLRGNGDVDRDRKRAKEHKKSVLMLNIFEWKCNNVKEEKDEGKKNKCTPIFLDRLKCGKNKK